MKSTIKERKQMSLALGNPVETPIEGPRLSYSKINCFATCKQQFKYAYREKLPRTQSPMAEVGTYCHQILETFVNYYSNSDTFSTLACMLKAYSEAHVPYDIKDEVKEIVIKWMEYQKVDFKTLYGTEVKIIIDNNLHGKIVDDQEWKDAKNFFFRCIIDRLHIDQKTAYIHDYKTNHLQNADGLQLLLYAWAVSKVFPIERAYGIFEYIRFWRVTDEIPWSKLNLEDAERELVHIAKYLQDMRDYPAKIGNHCQYCPYLHLCEEAKKLKYDSTDIIELGNYVTITEERLKRAKQQLKDHINKNGPIPMDDGTEWEMEIGETEVFDDPEAFERVHAKYYGKEKRLKPFEYYYKGASIDNTRTTAKFLRDIPDFNRLLVKRAKYPALKRKQKA